MADAVAHLDRGERRRAGRPTGARPARDADLEAGARADEARELARAQLAVLVAVARTALSRALAAAAHIAGGTAALLAAGARASLVALRSIDAAGQAVAAAVADRAIDGSEASIFGADALRVGGARNAFDHIHPNTEGHRLMADLACPKMPASWGCDCPLVKTLVWKGKIVKL